MIEKKSYLEDELKGKQSRKRNTGIYYVNKVKYSYIIMGIYALYIVSVKIEQPILLYISLGHSYVMHELKYATTYTNFRFANSSRN